MANKSVVAARPIPAKLADTGIVEVLKANRDANDSAGLVAEAVAAAVEAKAAAEANATAEANAIEAAPIEAVEIVAKGSDKATTAGGVAGLSQLADLAKPTAIVEIKRETGLNMEKMMKSAEDFVSFSQGNMEAFVKSSQIWAAGFQDMGKAMAATAQAQVDAAVATMKAMSGVKSIKDAVDLHTTLARSSVETVMAETGKLTDASMKLAEQALAPITARVTLATEKFGRTA
jgi:phasin family protein